MTRELSIDTSPTDSLLEGLAERAKRIQAQLERLTDPVVVEFSGSPKSGKSTNIDIIHHFFKRMRFKVWAPTEGASKRTPYTLRSDMVAFNAWSLNYAISELLLSYHNVDKQHLVILDRGPFDSLAWMGVLQERGDLDEAGYSIIKNFALLPKWAKLVDRIYLFTCDPKVSLERETDHKLTVVPGTAMNDIMLTKLLERYRALVEELSDYPVRTVDTNSGSGARNSSYAIVEDLLGCFEAKLEQGT